LFLSSPSRAICSSSRTVSRLGYEAAFPFSILAMPQHQLRHESLDVAIAIDPVSILASQEQISIIKPMENIQEVGHLQLKTEPHGGSNSEIQRYWEFLVYPGKKSTSRSKHCQGAVSADTHKFLPFRATVVKTCGDNLKYICFSSSF